MKEFSGKGREVKSQGVSNGSLRSLCGLWDMGHKKKQNTAYLKRDLKSMIRGKED